MIKGNRVILRPPEEPDINFFYEWRNDSEIKALSLMHPFPVAMESEKEWYDNITKTKDNHLVFFSIVDIESDKLIGYTKLFNINWIHRFCYFGIVIGDKKYQGKGIGTEVTSLMTEYAFAKLNLRKIILEVIYFNEKAIKLYKKLGFLEEGRLIKHIFINGNWHDILIMSLFRE